jgi:hypothetical protein
MAESQGTIKEINQDLSELNQEQRDLVEAEERRVGMRRHQAPNVKQDALECTQARLEYPWMPSEYPDGLRDQWLKIVRLGKGTMEQVRASIEGWKAKDGK